MKPPDGKKNGADAATPTPETINPSLEMTETNGYPERWCTGNQNEQWLLVSRSLFEDAIQQSIDWLDLNDRLAEEADGKAEAPENAA